MSDPRFQDDGDDGMSDPRFQDDGDDDHSSHATNIAEKDMRLWQNDGSYSNWWNGDQEVVQFRAIQDQEKTGSDDSGFCSPPLWKNSTSPHKSSSQPLLSHHVHTSLSPNSRLQAITRGQRELMDMVRNLPESSYELSLQDLVEHRQMEPPQASPFGGGLNSSKRSLQQRGGVKDRRQGRRSGSFEIENTGLFLKMGFPFSLQSKKRNKFAGSGSGTGKVSPRPEGIKGSSSGGERDWWKKKFTGSRDSDSGGSSTTTTSSNAHTYGSSRSNKPHTYATTRIKYGFLSSCSPFSQCRISKYVD